jgi:predicted amidophosphoribosyltransferase
VSQAQPVPIESPECPLCGTPVGQAETRCPECGYDLAGVGERPRALSRMALVWSAMSLLAVYLVTLAIVAATR